MDKSDIEMVHDNATIKWDPEALAYYVTPSTRPNPPFTKQIHVEAIVDVGDDGSFAGIEIIDPRMPQPHVPEIGGGDGRDVLEKFLQIALDARPEDAPFGMDPEEAEIWHRARAAAYQHALELIGDTKIPLPGRSLDRLNNEIDALEDLAEMDAAEIAGDEG